MSRGHRQDDGQTGQHGNDLSFLDFLRSAGGTVPISHDHSSSSSQQQRQRQNLPFEQQRQNSGDSAERKRRHTGSDPERRNYPYPTYTARPSGVRGGDGSPPRLAGGSREHAIDLTSSSPPSSLMARPGYPRMYDSSGSLPSNRSYGRYGRRESDIVLPRWQPDHEVNKCPVCETEFSLLYRRHHCRKCGRVVCARCSPHRITIPRQYIVQPPDIVSLYADDPASPLRNPALGGGEVVRVCNPCVPDPWTPDAGSPSLAATQFPHDNTHPPSVTHPPRQDSATRGSQDRYRSIPVPPGGRNRAQSHQQTNDQRRQHEFSRLFSSSAALDRYARNFRYSPHDIRAPSTQGSGSEPGQHSHPQHIDTMHRRGHSLNNRDLPYSRSALPAPIPPPTSRPPPAPRRQVAEEDECPVCGNEMPPGEAVRERHINECIAARMAPSSSSTPPVAPAAAANIVPSTTSGTTPPQAEGSRPRTTSFRPRGMVKSIATEKDCVEASGEARECPICYEDFQPGDELGRMECLCLFHRTCIRGWWERKGVGSCPTPHFD
ncbi:unnamed protein product [Cercospora beticola]|nr:unnamed protein product [Cercospora beticola]